MSTSNNSSTAHLPRSAAGNRSPWLMAIIASIATFMELLDSTIANVSLYHISASLSVSYSESLWVLTSYIVANALVLPMSGWLSNTIGRKRYYMLSIAGFTIGSLLCSIATSIEFLIIARVLQGLSGGGLAPVEQSMITDSFPIEKRPHAFALYGITILVAPAIGPFVGGWLTENMSWHWIFLINVPIGIVSLILSYYFIVEPPLLKEERKQRKLQKSNIDYVGISLVIIGFGTLQLFLDRYEINDGFSSSFICTMAVTAAVSLSFLVIWEWFHPQPIMDIRLLRHRNFTISSLIIFLIGFLSYSTTQVLPQMTQELFNYTAAIAGVMLGIGGLLVIVPMAIVGAITNKIAYPQCLVVVGLLGTAISTWHMSQMTLSVDFATFVWARLLQVIWFPVMLIPVSLLAYEGLPANKSNEAAAFAALMRNIGGSVGLTLMANMLHSRTNMHYSRISDRVTESVDLSVSLENIKEIAFAQARLLSYLDIFYLMAAVCLIFIPLAFLFKTPKKGKKKGSCEVGYGHHV
ncbi:DHA2 family efflux MFS transporter permease subunit [Budviciaceae bacterium CWB-B4]|uniref:DHA2 family efflux MFS transporter permease subunit n=1 Tax=Limnobaculum xujianqingii TaxID=2738837 RepID=A0A9D7AG12_9GAMM|nr:DHA2 family efflux MFS transporter permease subunit [Limnobaculum xujianqingii]MBK5072034.1 DHA2 family efflux MFS transporter permease subunit [Limnobaculum xujianqingii]MBK5175343.1 DHA2 family efflux MFS transporter permease subunit [Limnobaculum xujianqingii]